MRKFHITAFLVILGMLFGNCGDLKKAYGIKDTGDSEKEVARIALLTSLVSRTSTTGTTGTTGTGVTPSCTGISTFSAVSTAEGGKCVSCHGALGGFTFNYSGALTRVTAGSPESSSLYTIVTTGSMASKSDATINTAIYCWIKDGAKP
jgi:hypothetical protein